MKKPQFVDDNFYHIYNRGVEKRKVFLEKNDYFRFVHDLYEFNDEAPAGNSYYYRHPQISKSSEVQPRKISQRKLLVEIVAFCLMPNHFHLFLRQHAHNGVVTFMQKLGTGYTMYFNQKYERVGGLFQGRFKAIHINNDRHFLYLPHYIHLNPLDTVMPQWREGKIKNGKQAAEFLKSYRWSSYPDYIGEKNFPSVISHKLFQELFGTPAEYKKSISEWLRDMRIEDIEDISLE